MGELMKVKGKEKHNHKLTDFLKFIIFACIMIAPFFSVLSRCLYVTFNKNAENSYYGETVNELLPISVNYNDIVVNELYYINGANTRVTSGNYRVQFTEMTITNVDLTGYSVFQIFPNGGYTTLGIYGDNVASKYYVLENTPVLWSFRIGTYEEVNFIGTIDMYYMQPNRYSYLDNAFIYSIYDLNNQPVFSWAKNTAIYTAIDNMTTGLGFTNDSNVLALLLAYWSLNTAVYIVFDIILWAFTKLTHFVND